MALCVSLAFAMDRYLKSTFGAALALLQFAYTFDSHAQESLLNQLPAESAIDTPSIFDLQFEKEQPERARFENLIDKSTVTLNLRNFYFNRGRPEALDTIAWAQGGSIEYQSGKADDIFWIEGEFFTSYKLYGPDEHNGTLILESGQDDIEVLAVAAAKADLSGNLISFYRQKYNLPFLNEQDNRMIPNTFEGYTIAMPKLSNEKFQYVAGYIDQIKRRDSDHFVPMSEATGVTEKDRGIFIGGARYYLTPNLQIGAINLYGEDLHNTSYAELIYNYRLTEILKGRTSLQFADQRSTGEDLIRGDQYSTNFWGIEEALTYKNAVIRAAFTQTDSGGLVRSSFGTHPGYTVGLVEDFNRAGERAWLLGLVYNFGSFGLKDLSINTAYTDGSGAIDEITKEALPSKNEFDITIDYRPSEGLLKGFWLRLRSGTVDEERRHDTQDFRVILNYEIPLHEPGDDMRS